MDGISASELRPLAPQVLQLFAAVTRGDIDETSRLLRLGVPVNELDPVSTDSPLMVACRKGFSEIVQLCLDYGAKNDPHPDFGQTALHACVASIQHTCASVLLQVAAESEADDLICNLTDQNGQTPLHTATVVGSGSLAELLLRHGATLGALDAFGQTPIHLAAGSGMVDAVDCLALLLSEGGDDPSLLNLPDVFGNTPLHHAAYHGRLECARLLLQSAADVSLRNAKNLTAYNLATTQGHHPLALLLLDYRDAPRENVRDTPIKGNNYSSIYSTPGQKQPRSVWTTPLQSASKPSYNPHSGNQNQRKYSDDLSGMSFATPRTSDRPKSKAKRTFMHADYINKDISDDEANVDESSAVYINVAQPNVNNTNNNIRRNTKSQVQDTAQLPRPHTMSHSSPSTSMSTKSSRLNHSSGNLYSGNYSNSAASSPRPVTARLEDVSISIDGPFNHDLHDGSTSLKRRSPLRSQATPSSPPSNNFHNDTNNYHNNTKQFYTHNIDNDPQSLSNQKANNMHHNNHYDTNNVYDSHIHGCREEETVGFMPPNEEFYHDETQRPWASYETEDGFLYYLSNDPVTGEAHSQWEDPRHYGLVLTHYETDYVASEVEPGSIISNASDAPVQDVYADSSLVLDTQYTTQQYKDSPDSVASSEHGGNEFQSPKRSRSPNHRYSNSPSPQRLPPLSPTLRMHPNKLMNSHSKLTKASPMDTNLSVNVNNSVILVEDDEDEENIDAMKVLVRMLDQKDPNVTMDGNASVLPTPSGDHFEEHNTKQTKTSVKSHSIVRTIDWDKETSNDQVQSVSESLLETGTQNHTKERKYKKTVSSRAAFLSPMSSDDDSDLDKSLEVRVINRPNANLHHHHSTSDNTTNHDKRTNAHTESLQRDALALEIASAVTLPPHAVQDTSTSTSNSTEVGQKPSKTTNNNSKLRGNRSWMTAKASAEDETAVNEEKDLTVSDETVFEEVHIKSIDLASLSPTKATLLTLDFNIPSSVASVATPVQVVPMLHQQNQHNYSNDVNAKEEAEQMQKKAKEEQERQEKEEEERLLEESAKEISANIDDLSVMQRVRRRLEEELMKPTAFILRVLARADEISLMSNTTSTATSDCSKINTNTNNNSNANNKQEDLSERLAQAVSDPVLGKYAKMARMGVPAPSVLIKMGLDKVPETDVHRMKVVLGLASNDANNNNNNNNEQQRVIVALPEERLRRSIWAFTCDANSNNNNSGGDTAEIQSEEHVAEEELRELEAMFRRNNKHRALQGGTSGSAADKVSQMTAQAKKQFALLLLEPRRAQNVTIGLTAFRPLLNNNNINTNNNMVGVLKAVCELNDLDGQLTPDLLDQLRVLLPTESEVKRSHLLTQSKDKDTVTHPAELFVQVALLFYPELPLRLSVFVSVTSYSLQIQSALSRLAVFVNAINTVLSSTRLAQLLQRLLIVSHRATDRRLDNNSSNNNSNVQSSSNNVTLLEQLVKLSQTRAVTDGRTSVLEFAVRGLYERHSATGEGIALVHCALNDLATLEDTQLKPGTHVELMHDCDALETLLNKLKDEQKRLETRRLSFAIPTNNTNNSNNNTTYSSTTSTNNLVHTPMRNPESQSQPQQQGLGDLGSPTAKQLSDAYERRLETHVLRLETQLVSQVRLHRRRLQQKTKALVDYFGEDFSVVKSPCAIFSALRDLRRDLAFAKEQVEWRMYRQQQQQNNNN